MNKRLLGMIPVMAALIFSSVVCNLPARSRASVGQNASQGATANPGSNDPGGMDGSISGVLSYPSEFLPPQRVVAFRVVDGKWTKDYRYVDTVQGESEYTIGGLKPGSYWVIAYPGKPVGQSGGLAGGYSQAVPCGLSVDCKDHTLLVVPVEAGKDTSGVNPGDWYAPAGTFPKSPVP